MKIRKNSTIDPTSKFQPPSAQLQDPDSEGKIIVDVKPGQLMSSEDDLLDLTCGRRATGGTALLNVQGIDSKLRKAGNITLDTFRLEPMDSLGVCIYK